MLISGRFLFVRPFPPLQIPNLKTPAVAHQRDLAFQSERSTKFLRQNKAALSIRACVLSARMQVPQENSEITRRNTLVCFRGRTRFRKLLWRHHEQAKE